MQSLNFEFLRRHRRELADLGGFAETYAFSDPSSSLVKLRQLAETVVQGIYSDLKLERPYQANLNDLLNEDAFRRAVPHVVLNKIHSIRILGNKAAHGDQCSDRDALSALQQAFDLVRWLYVTFYKGAPADCANFRQPTTVSKIEQTEAQKKQLEAKLAAQEAEMQTLLTKLEAERIKVSAQAQDIGELQAVLEAGNKAAESLQFDEAATRKQLIDAMLIDVGWGVDINGKSNESVAQELEVDKQPTTTGKGYVDYVLWGDDGKPLAVVEAKKTAVSPQRGQTQAKLYADSLEAKYGQRPVIFYSNGFETYIWNDALSEPPRRIYGFYSKDSLQYLLFKRIERQPLETIAPDPRIAGRMYQIEAIKRVCERFSGNHRRSLIVQATGTGKTRVAISLCDTLVRAKRAKRILFLCDRKELRKQALNTFKEFLPAEPRTVVNSETHKDRNKRIYLATYPAMMKCMQSFDVGFFDLIIADESHRSIYNRYRDLFYYFDSLQVGLTATPVQFISRNTYKMFGCEDQDPTSYFSFDQAVNHKPPYLVPFEVVTHTTGFLRDGIKYSAMNEKQRQELEDQLEDASTVEFDDTAVDRQIFNKDTNRAIIRNLMESGIRDASGNRPGKSIIFARSHNHAMLLQEVFDEMYPQYGGRFCQVIDNYDPRAEQLIDDFKGIGSNPDLTIAISVDMLDTGIDIPAVVNLVFAKPVKSYVKFWQMIGRGTRLCENLFGPGKHKQAFRIFDHWSNFEFFDEHYKPVEPSKHKSLLQRVFETKIALAEVALDKGNLDAFDLSIKQMAEDIAALPETSVSIKEKWREIKSIQQGDTLKSFAAATRNALRNDIAPLMQWRDSRGNDEAYSFDLLVTTLQVEMLRGSASFADLKDKVIDAVSDLTININQVREKIDLINRIKSSEFWTSPTITSLENMRAELRGIMKYRRTQTGGGALPTPIIDVKEDPSQIESNPYQPKLAGLQLAAYRKRVEEVLQQLFNTAPVLQKIRRAEAVSENDIESLCSLVLTQHPDVDLHKLAKFYPEMSGNLVVLVRSIIGLESEAVGARFEEFVQKHPSLTAKQTQFLQQLKNYIAQNGGIELDDLYEPPFTLIDSDGFDGVFPNESLANDLIAIITTFIPKQYEKQAYQ
jgi:type I restriction enzyme R subunit